MVFPTFFHLRLNLAIRSSNSEPQSAPGQCRRHGFNPWSGKSPHATVAEMVHHSYSTTTAAPTCPRACAPYRERPPQGEAHRVRPEKSLRAPKTQHSQNKQTKSKNNTFWIHLGNSPLSLCFLPLTKQCHWLQACALFCTSKLSR